MHALLKLNFRGKTLLRWMQAVSKAFRLQQHRKSIEVCAEPQDATSRRQAVLLGVGAATAANLVEPNTSFAESEEVSAFDT